MFLAHFCNPPDYMNNPIYIRHVVFTTFLSTLGVLGCLSGSEQPLTQLCCPLFSQVVFDLTLLCEQVLVENNERFCE